VLRKIAGFACLVGSLGGGTAESVRDPGACPGRCERSIVYTLDARFDTGERGVIGEAMRVWENGTSGRVCFLAGGHGGEDLVVEKLDRSEQLRPWDPDWSQHVALTKDDHIWIVAPRIDDADEYRALVVHELGHHLGIGHIEDAAATYMHSMINDTPVELRLHARLPERDARAFCQVVRCTCSL
jgi:hypothetical protein